LTHANLPKTEMATGASSADYFEHGADIGIVGRGATLEQAFEAAARAMFAIVADPAAVGRDAEADVIFEESDPELALVQWLNALLAAAREHGAVWAEFALQRDGDCWRGHARGAGWRLADERGVEVKGATLTELSVRKDAVGWEARCVVDV
jgi:SHS2 domain-containing protein